MTGDYTPQERAALDRLTVPAPRATLAADIVSKAMAAQDRPAPPPRRDGRGGWRRRGVVLASAGALLLASAAAATTGLLDRLPAALPAIASAIGVMPRPRPERPRPVHVVKRSAPPVAPAPVPAAPQTLQQRADELRAQRIAQGLPVMRPGVRAAIKRRIARRIEAMPPARQASVRAKIDEINAMTPEQRANTIELARQRILQRRPAMARRLQERRAARSGQDDAVAFPLAEPPSAIERDAMVERFRERRRLRLERRRRMMEADAAPPAGTAPEK